MRWACALLSQIVLLGCGSDPAPSSAPVSAASDPFCKTRPKLVFCEDFDETTLPGAFSAQVVTGAELSIAAPVAPSPPSPPKALSILGKGGASERALLTKTFAAGNKFRVFFLLSVEPVSAAAGTTELVSLDFSAAFGTPYKLGLRVDGAGGYTATETLASTTRSFPASSALPAREWTSLRFDVDFTDVGVGKLRVTFGDETVVNNVAITPPGGSAAPTLALGLAAEGAKAGFRVHYDNVTFQDD